MKIRFRCIALVLNKIYLLCFFYITAITMSLFKGQIEQNSRENVKGLLIKYRKLLVSKLWGFLKEVCH